MGLAERRHHVERIKARRRSYWNGHAGTNARMLGKCARTPHPCSCIFCRSPREWDGPAIRDRRQAMRSTEATIDAYDGLLIVGMGEGCAAEGMVE
jgi:hypothetical protein